MIRRREDGVYSCKELCVSLRFSQAFDTDLRAASQPASQANTEHGVENSLNGSSYRIAVV
jgi:hypothetical protein